LIPKDDVISLLHSDWLMGMANLFIQ